MEAKLIKLPAELWAATVAAARKSGLATNVLVDRVLRRSTAIRNAAAREGIEIPERPTRGGDRRTEEQKG